MDQPIIEEDAEKPQRPEAQPMDAEANEDAKENAPQQEVEVKMEDEGIKE